MFSTLWNTNIKTKPPDNKLIQDKQGAEITLKFLPFQYKFDFFQYFDAGLHNFSLFHEADMNKPATVEKTIPVSYDLGNLAVADPNPVDSVNEQLIHDVTRDNVQLLVNQLLQLPVRRTAESIASSSNQDSTQVLFQLPEPLWDLPREKPLPKDKPKTRWEEFAAKKGINKKAKNGKLVFDEESQEWVPKWGYGGINKKGDNEWLVELDEEKQKPGDDSELIDPRKLHRDERKKLVKKNQVQQKRNAQRAGI